MSIAPEEIVHYNEVLDWNSDPQKIELALELPFWILATDNRYNVTVNEHTLTIETVNAGISVQGGNEHTAAHNYQRFFGRIPLEENDHPRYKVIDLLRGSNFRYTKTQLWITTAAASDAIAAFNEGGIRESIAREYFSALAKAHLPFVNKLINGYRAATYDPFATEITEFDVPGWFLVVDGSLKPIYLMYTLCRDEFPITRVFATSEASPVFLESPDVVEAAMRNPLVPGEAELLDAWSLCYRGRFSECIRSAVTAVEVLLEDKLRHSLKSLSLSQSDIDDRLAFTKNRFSLRLDDYCRASGRCVPGPTLHNLPYLNGIRLREQFERTRQLRHDVVHRGERLDPSLKNPIRRAVETTTWLFDWLAGEAKVGSRQSKHYTLFEAWRGPARMKWDVSSKGVVVRPVVDNEQIEDLLNGEESVPPQCLADLTEVRIIESIDEADIPDAIFQATLNRFQDLEHFALMAIAKLKFESAHDIFQDPAKERLPERWRIDGDEFPVFVFLFQLVKEFELTDYEELRTRIEARRSEECHKFSAVAIVHELKDLDWTLHSNKPIPAGIDKQAQADSIAIIRTDDLARFASGARRFDWLDSDIQLQFTSPGWSRLFPPNSVSAGVVKRLYPKLQVLSVQLNGQHSVSVGCFMYLRLRDKFVRFKVESMQENGAEVEIATVGLIGLHIGDDLNLLRSDLPDDAELFVQTDAFPSELDTSKPSRLQEMLKGLPPVF
ncbi:MAG: hypothetical protein R3C17_20605 [Planctomycetaceae bacterium]